MKTEDMSATQIRARLAGIGTATIAPRVTGTAADKPGVLAMLERCAADVTEATRRIQALAEQLCGPVPRAAAKSLTATSIGNPVGLIGQAEELAENVSLDACTMIEDLDRIQARLFG